MQKEQNNWYDITMNNGEVYEVNEEQFQIVRKILSAAFKDRQEFIDLGEGEIIKTSYIENTRKERG